MKASAMPLVLAAFSALFATAQQPAPQQPASIDVPAGARVVLQAKGNGVQVYTCSQTPDGIKWTLTGPEAKLIDASGKVIGTHFAGPTWKLKDGGQVQGQKIADQPSPNGSIPWLLLRAKAGTATGSLGAVAYIRRTETHGGVAPASGCRSAKAVAKTKKVRYTAAYTFYAEK